MLLKIKEKKIFNMLQLYLLYITSRVRLILCLARRSLTTEQRVSWRCVSLIFRSVYLIEGCDVRAEEDEEKAELFILKYLWGSELNMSRKRKMRGGKSHLRRGKWFAALATAHSVIYHVSYKLRKLHTIRYIMRALEKSNIRKKSRESKENCSEFPPL